MTIDTAASSFLRGLTSLADDHLILGHRVSEWCGHAPMLEEDLSLPNMALDLLGQARNIYAYIVSLEGKSRSEDDLAFMRSDRDYRNCLLVEHPNTDFAYTMLRQLYFSAFMLPYWQSAQNSKDLTVVGIAGKAEKEMAYHVRHSAQWVIRLGDGTELSAQRMQAAVNTLHAYTGELFQTTESVQVCVSQALLPDPELLQTQWQQTIDRVFTQAQLTAPQTAFFQSGGRRGIHTEDFGHLLSEMQYMQRSYPGLSW